MHGSLGRDNTFNNMAAIGPDFKQRFVDPVPVSNADIARTLAKVLKFQLPSNGALEGRILNEAVVGGEHDDEYDFEHEIAVSLPTPNLGFTVLEYQTVDGHRYFDRACFVALRQPGSLRCLKRDPESESDSRR